MGPLHGTRVIEIAGVGPGPFAAMVLSDLGAEVIRIDRAQSVIGGDPDDPPRDFMNRGRRSLAVDLKNPQGVETVLRLVEKADILIEGFRPGVMERLGLGPEVCAARNAGLIYGRITGWGQDGPLAQAAGHDINYIALTGALNAIGRSGERPVPPLNLVGDFGGGGMLLVVGVLAALAERAGSGQGQVVDAAMIDGASLLATMMHSFRAMGGYWKEERGTNLLDSGAHFYEVYETSDGKYVALGAIEPQFYADLLQRSGLAGEELPHQMDRNQWPALKERFASLFKCKTRDEWCALLEGGDACFAPVLSFGEAPAHPHNAERKGYVEMGGQVHPAPAPRFSRTPAEVQGPPAHAGQHSEVILREWGFPEEDILALREAKAVV